MCAEIKFSGLFIVCLIVHTVSSLSYFAHKKTSIMFDSFFLHV